MTHRRAWTLICGWAAVAGTVVMVVGTFEPWLQSGAVTRNSYRAAGVMQRLLGLDGWAKLGLDALPYLSLAVALAAVVFIAGYPRSAAILQVVLAAGMGAVALRVLATDGAVTVHVRSDGPTITLIGSFWTLFAAIGLLIMTRGDLPAAPPSPSIRPPNTGYTDTRPADTRYTDTAGERR